MKYRKGKRDDRNPLGREIATESCGCEWVCDINGDMAAEYRMCDEHKHLTTYNR